MSEWKNININLNQIEHQTEKAVLIKCPHNSAYDGWVFWHPAKLLRNGRHSFALAVGYTDEFVFHLKKFGKGYYNKGQVLAEKDITAKELEEIFQTVDQNIVAKKRKPKSKKKAKKKFGSKSDPKAERKESHASHSSLTTETGSQRESN